MPHPTEQGGAPEQGWSDRHDDTVSPSEGGPAEAAGERARAYPVAAPVARASPAPSGWPPPTNTKAIIALCTAFPVPVLGIVFGVMARREIARTGEDGRAYATWGLAVGIALCSLIALYLVLVLLYLVFLIVVVANLGDAFAAGAGPGPGA